MSRELIYSKRYPALYSSENGLVSFSGEPYDTVEVCFPHHGTEPDELIREFADSTVFKPEPAWEEKAEEAKKEAIFISGLYGLDIDIYKTEWYTTFVFYLPYAPFTGRLLDAFKKLISLCDRFLIVPPEDDAEKYGLEIRIKTHHAIIAGREI